MSENQHWRADETAVALCAEDTFYVLRFSREAYEEAVSSGAVDEDGVEAAFEVITDQPETVTSGAWVGDCFVYGTSTHRLNYLVGEKTYTLAHFDQPMYLLGYLRKLRIMRVRKMSYVDVEYSSRWPRLCL